MRLIKHSEIAKLKAAGAAYLTVRFGAQTLYLVPDLGDADLSQARIAITMAGQEIPEVDLAWETARIVRENAELAPAPVPAKAPKARKAAAESPAPAPAPAPAPVSGKGKPASKSAAPTSKRRTRAV